MARIIPSLFLLLSLASSVLAHEPSNKTCSSCASLIFRENKGQWEKQVLYKSEVKSGAVFFEHNQITFNLYDARDVKRIKGDHHKLEGFTPTIDYTMHFHAFRMKFAGANLRLSLAAAKAFRNTSTTLLATIKANGHRA
jgi:hypothetical protein